jgi:hypothetical protein
MTSSAIRTIAHRLWVRIQAPAQHLKPTGPRKPRTIHFHPTNETPAACGVQRTKNLTTSLTDTTCAKCRKSDTFTEAAQARKRALQEITP